MDKPIRVCKVPGCDSTYRVSSNSYCRKHEERFKKYGDTSIVHTSKRHGMSFTSEYQAWAEMKRRCKSTHRKTAERYYHRKIIVCEWWDSKFENFYMDMGEKPSSRHSLDRINNDMNYSCGHCSECLENGWEANCRWATYKEQCNNKGNNRIIEVNGEILNLSQWAEKIGITVQALNQRINKLGWTLEQALNTPKRSRKK